MAAQRSKRRLVVVICAVLGRRILRGARRMRAAVAPRAQAALAVVVRVSGCSGTDAEVVTAHVVLAALGAGALALAAALAGPGHSHALQVAGVLGVSAIALHAVVIVARHHGVRRPLRPLLASSLDRLLPAQGQVPAARLLAVACEPERLWVELPRAREALALALRTAFRLASAKLALARAKQAVPGLGQALQVMDACEAALASARFVRELALAASDADYPLLAA